MRGRLQATADARASETDAELAGRASAGEMAAFEELYRRHVQAAWRLAQAVTGNADDAADAVSDAFTRVFQALPAGRLQYGQAFRPYLMSAARNAAVDVLRRSGRARPTDPDEQAERPALGAEPSELVLRGADSALVASAFRSLPERWRSVLWLTEVEGIPARDAAQLLGVSANGVAQLAARARAGLRQRYLQAHVGRGDVDQGCRFTVDRLGAYVADGLAPRDISKVDQHLAGCEACRARLAELRDLGSTLRRTIIPLPLGLAAMSVGKWRLATSGATTGAANAASGAASVALKAQRPLAAASVALFAAGIVGMGVVDRAPGSRAGGTRRSPALAVAPPPAVTFTPAVSTPELATPPLAATEPLPTELPRGEEAPAAPTVAQAATPAATPARAAPLVAPPKDRPAAAPPAPLQPLQVVVQANVEPAPVALAVGDCTGAQVATLTVACTPPVPPPPAPPEAAPIVAVTTTTGGLGVQLP